MIRACCWKHHLPSKQPDQISQVVTQSRTVRKGKAGLYPTEWKIMEEYGSFGGLDTWNHVEFGNFEKRYFLIFDNEDKAIANQYYVNTRLDVLF